MVIIFLSNYSYIFSRDIISEAYIYGLMMFNLNDNEINTVFIKYIENGDIGVITDYFDKIKLTNKKKESRYNESIIYCVNELVRIQCLGLNDKNKKLFVQLSIQNSFKLKNVLKNDIQNYRYGIIRLWSYIDYLYPYRCELENWENVLLQSEKILYESNDIPKNYLKSIKFITMSLNDRHTLIDEFIKGKRQHISVDEVFKKELIIPFTIERKDNDIYIKRTINSNFIYNNERLVSINGETPLTYIDTIRFNKKRISEEEIVLCSRGRYDTIFLLKDTFVVENITLKDYSMFLNNARKNENFKYPYFDIFSNPTIQASFFECDTIILDMRGYPIIRQSEKNVSLFCNTSIFEDFTPNYSIPGSFIVSKKKIFKGNLQNDKQIIYVLINSFTGSFSEHLCLALKTNKNVCFIGSQSSNSFGMYDENNKLELPFNIIFNTTKVGLVHNGKIPYDYKGEPFKVYPIYYIEQ